MNRTTIIEIQDVGIQLEEKARELRKLFEQAVRQPELTTKHSWIKEVESTLRAIRHDEMFIETRL